MLRHLAILLTLLATAGTLRAAAQAPTAAGAAGNGTPAPQAPATGAVRFTGRALEGTDGSLSFDWSGSHFTFRFEGTRCTMHAADSHRNYYNVFVDGRLYGKATTEGPCREIVLTEGLPAGEHTVLVQKRTEAEQGRTTLYGVSTDGRLLPPPAARKRLIEFIGDSHTCGYGTEGKSPKEPFTPETENCNLAWGCIIARYFDADYTLIAHSGQGMVRNWGDRPEGSACTMRERLTRTFDMEEEPQWNFAGYRPDIVVIKLGSNDYSEDISPSKEAFNGAYAEALRKLRKAYGDVPVLCVAPCENTTVYGHLKELLEELQDPNLHCMVLTPGLFNWDSDMGANFHPNHRGHRKMASAVIPYIATITGWEMPEKVVY